MADQPRAIQIQLVPPPDVSFFSNETKEIFKDKSVTWQDDDKSTSAGTISWSVDIYKYCTGALPTDRDFADRGAVVLIFIHHGFVNIGHIHYDREFSVTPEMSKMMPAVQQPTIYSGEDGSTWNYTIDYQETFQMFKNEGNETTSFQAIYHEDFAREKSKQTGYLDDYGGVTFVIKYQKDPGRDAKFCINGLSVFKCKDPNAFPMTFRFDYDSHLVESDSETLSATASASVSVSRGF